MSQASLIRFRCVHPAKGIQWVDHDLLDWDAPFDLPPPPVGGQRVVDSPHVFYTGDRLPTEFGYTASGNLYATTPEGLKQTYFKIKGLLRYADQVWRGDRYLKLSYAVLGATSNSLAGQCVVPAAIACAVKELRWYDKDGPLE